MHIQTATKADLPAVRRLVTLHRIDKCHIDTHHFNHRDISLKAVNPATGELIGFAWGGLMAKNKIMYVDKVIVHPDYQGYGVIQGLYAELMKRALKIGVEETFGIIRQDQYHNQAAKNALKFAFAADPLPFTYVYASTKHVLKELSNGR